MFEGNLDTWNEFSHKLEHGGGKLASTWNREDVLVSIFSHEMFHDTDTKSVANIKARISGGTDNYKVETTTYEVNKKVLAEIAEKKNNEDK